MGGYTTYSGIVMQVQSLSTCTSSPRSIKGRAVKAAIWATPRPASTAAVIALLSFTESL
ncbi:hypothetical protein D3C86_2074510 [compost metagenome]